MTLWNDLYILYSGAYINAYIFILGWLILNYFPLDKHLIAFLPPVGDKKLGFTFLVKILVFISDYFLREKMTK